MINQDVSWGPGYAKTADASTGPGAWIKPRGLLSTWGYTVTSAGSTSTITTTGRLEGTLSDSTAPTAAEIATLSTKTGVGYVAVTGKPARQVRWNTLTLTSTSSTAPNVTVRLGGTL
ncbi:MAG: hypothetical protein WC718_07245 [Phycisphaerales bacterium]|jgi:hypothetical protein